MGAQTLWHADFFDWMSVKFGDDGLARQWSTSSTGHGLSWRRPVRHGRSALSCGRAVAAQWIDEECH